MENDDKSAAVSRAHHEHSPPVRCVVRVQPDPTASAHDRGTLFIAGAAVELVPPNSSSGVRHVFSRLFDTHAKDAEIFEHELAPLVEHFLHGVNVSVVLAGHMRSGRASLFHELTVAAVDKILDTIANKQSDNAELRFALGFSHVAAHVGTDQLTDLLSSGSTPVDAVEDPVALNGVTIPELISVPVGAKGVVDETLRVSRARLSQGRPPPPSSVARLVLRQWRVPSPTASAVSASAAAADGEIIATLTISDVEVGALGDPISNGLRQVLSTEPREAAHLTGAALMLADTVSGNAHSLIIGTIRALDHDESAATLALVAGGLKFVSHPLVNDAVARGLLTALRWRIASLQMQLSAAAGTLQRSVDQLHTDRRALPNQLIGATERLQSVVDQMERDAAGAANERQALMAELLELRARANAADGELVALKEELIREKREKLSLSRELVQTQLESNEELARSQQQSFALEQEALGSADLLRQLESKVLHIEEELAAKAVALSESVEKSAAAERERALAVAQADSLRGEVLSSREREDELSLQLLNCGNALAAAEGEAERAGARLESLERDSERLRERANEATAHA